MFVEPGLRYDQLQGKLRCLVSIGTGVPIALATETQKTAEQFRRDHSDLNNSGWYCGFNVDRGLENIGLEEAKKKNMIAVATDSYLESQEVYKRLDSYVKACRKLHISLNPGAVR